MGMRDEDRLALHALERELGSLRRRMQEIQQTAAVALSALARDRKEVVQERLELIQNLSTSYE